MIDVSADFISKGKKLTLPKNMPKTKAQAKFFVDQAKQLLKTETGPVRRRRIAIWGEEMNKLYMKLEAIPAPQKCKKCGIEKPVDDFGIVKSIIHYKTKKGKKRCYVNVARRKICNACMWPSNKKPSGIGSIDLKRAMNKNRNPEY